MNMNFRSTQAKARQCRFSGYKTMCAVFPLATPSAQASALVSCQQGDSGFVCHMRSVLVFLDATAWVLSLLLVSVLVAVVRIFRRKGRKLSREEVTPDAS